MAAEIGDKLYAVWIKWYEIGVGLKLSATTLDNLAGNTPEDKMLVSDYLLGVLELRNSHCCSSSPTLLPFSHFCSSTSPSHAPFHLPTLPSSYLSSSFLHSVFYVNPLQGVITSWIREGITEDPPPCWQRLLEVVDAPYGGQNPALASELAKQHSTKKGELGGDEFHASLVIYNEPTNHTLCWHYTLPN